MGQGKEWNEMTVTWTNGYGIVDAEPFVEWDPEKEEEGDDHIIHSPAVTLTFDRSSMCGAPARTVGWRDPGYIHTSFLKELWPNRMYTYKLGHRLLNGTHISSRSYQFRSSPYPGQASPQRVVIFGDMGKGGADGSSEYNNFPPESLNTTRQIVQDLENIDIVFHIGELWQTDTCHSGISSLHKSSLSHQQFLTWLAAGIMSMTGLGQDRSMETWILGESVEFWLRHVLCPSR